MTLEELENKEKELEMLKAKEQEIRDEIQKQMNNGNYTAVLCLRGNLAHTVRAKGTLSSLIACEKMFERYKKRVKEFEG